MSIIEATIRPYYYEIGINKRSFVPIRHGIKST